MKKYYQLLLFILSICSLSLFLVYRHEYNRLHYVLEVFNFFGQPCNITELQTSDNIANHYDWGVHPVWQESEGYHIYSAFWTTSGEVKALVLLGPSNKIATRCYLWYEDDQKPVVGTFKYSVLLNDLTHSQSGCFYYCTAKNNRNPYAVSFSIRDKRLTELKKIPLTVPANHRHNFTTTACVSPSSFSKVHLIEFLSYHKLIGVESFIFYSSTIPYRLIKIISNLSNRLGISVTFFPWNFPRFEGILTRSFVENDCQLRVGNVSRNVITLETDEYVVPARLYTLNEVLSSYDSQRNSERLSLPVQVFCVKSTNRRKPIALQNTEVNYNDDNTVRYIYRNSVSSNIVGTQVVVKGVASIHKYMYCSENAVRVYQDTSMLKFSTDFIRSTLVQLSLHDQI